MSLWNIRRIFLFLERRLFHLGTSLGGHNIAHRIMLFGEATSGSTRIRALMTVLADTITSQDSKLGRTDRKSDCTPQAVAMT